MEKRAKMCKLVLLIFLKILNFFSRTLRAKTKSCGKMAPTITAASVLTLRAFFSKLSSKLSKLTVSGIESRNL